MINIFSYCDPVISTASLIDNPEIKKLLNDRKDVHAGEMEARSWWLPLNILLNVLKPLSSKVLVTVGDGIKDSISDKWKP